MGLTSRDAFATALTAAAVAPYVAFLSGDGLPLVSGPRALAATVLLLGVAACAIGAQSQVGKQADAAPWDIKVANVLGPACFLLALFTVVTGNTITLALLVGTTVLLWLFATARHAFVGAGVGARHLAGDRKPRQLA
jgi:hypothetical protein